MWFLSLWLCLGTAHGMFLPILCGCLSAAMELGPSKGRGIPWGFRFFCLSRPLPFSLFRLEAVIPISKLKLPEVKDWTFQVEPVVKNLPDIARDIRDAGSIPGPGRYPGGGHGNPLLYSCLENPKDRGAL